MNKLTEEQKQRMKEGRLRELETKRVNRQKAFVFGEYQVYRLDTCNIVVDNGNGEKEWNYYPDFPSAIQSVFHRLIEPNQRQELSSLLKRIEAIGKEMKEVLNARGITEQSVGSIQGT